MKLSIKFIRYAKIGNYIYTCLAIDEISTKSIKKDRRCKK